MFFVVDKPNLQRIIPIVREDRSRKKDAEIPYLRLKAENTEMTITPLRLRAMRGKQKDLK